MTPAADGTALPAGSPNDAAPAARLRRGFGLLWWLTAATVILDQFTKALVAAMLPVYDSLTVIPNLLNLVHVHNAGVAFGMLNGVDHPQRAVFTTSLALVALFGIAYYARHVQPQERLARLGLSLILGGAIGNLVDRVRQGYVVDFVDVYWGDWHFWAFNVADAAISIGATLVFIEVIFLSRHAPHPVSDR